MKNLPYYKMKTNERGQRIQAWKSHKVRCGNEACAKEFVTRDPHKEYCSSRCRRDAYNKKRRAERVR